MTFSERAQAFILWGLQARDGRESEPSEFIPGLDNVSVYDFYKECVQVNPLAVSTGMHLVFSSAGFNLWCDNGVNDADDDEFPVPYFEVEMLNPFKQDEHLNLFKYNARFDYSKP